MKSGSPRPESLIGTERWKKTKPVAEPDDDAPGYGTGVDWGDFHAHVPWKGSK
jgi:hypothetical protein